MSWQPSMKLLPANINGFPVARSRDQPYSNGFDYLVYAHQHACILDALEREPDKQLFYKEGRFANRVELFALDIQPARFILDLDIKESHGKTPAEHERIAEDVSYCIVNIFNELCAPHKITQDNLWLADSCSTAIGSYHIILDGFCFIGMEGQRAIFRKLLATLPEYKDYFDDTQTSHHLLRMVNTHKNGRYKTLRHHGRPEKQGMFGYKKLAYPVGGDTHENMLNMVAAEMNMTSFANARDCKLVTNVRFITKRKYPSMAHPTNPETAVNLDKLKLVFPQIDQYVAHKQSGGRIELRRKHELFNVESHCKQCKTTHTSDNAYILQLSDAIQFNCWRAVKKHLPPLVLSAEISEETQR